MNKVLLELRRTITESRNSILWMTFASFVTGAIMVAIFPSVKEASTEMLDYIDAFPKEFLEAFGITSLDMSQFESYISSEYFGFFWIMVFLPFIVSWASQLGKVAENGTMALQLSFPISRIQIVLARLIDVTIKSILVGFVMVWTVVLLTIFIDVDLKLENWFLFSVLVSLFFTLVSVIGVLISIIVRKRGMTISILSALVIGSYFLNVITKLYDSIENLKYLSIFHYYGDPYAILMNGEIVDYSLLYYLFFITIFGAASLLLARKMEMPKG